MAKTKVQYLIANFVLSVIACVLTFIALGTESWVVSDVRFESAYNSEVEYGLFTGSYLRNVGGQKKMYQIEMTCSMGDNACAMLCGSGDKRENQLNNLINNKDVSFDIECTQIPRMFTRIFQDNYPRQAHNYDQTYINAGIWVSSIFFLVISGIASVLTAIFGLWNVIDNPVNPYFNILGLSIYNGVAACSALLVSILWGIHFGVTLTRNIAVLETIIVEAKSEGMAVLGFSYWLLFGSWLCHFTNLGLLQSRQYLMNKEPSVNVHYEEETDPGIIIY